jgi:clan AA aspartic protease (TIGR02281 family)
MQIDTGATAITISDSVAKALIAKGEAEPTTDGTYMMANGAKTVGKRVVIYDVRIGAHVLRDVTAVIVPDDAGMLLPFPVLNQVGRFTIDTNNSKLIFG